MFSLTLTEKIRSCGGGATLLRPSTLTQATHPSISAPHNLDSPSLHSISLINTATTRIATMTSISRAMSVAQHIRLKAERIASFVTAQRKALIEDRPLLVSMQGPQGCGECSASRETSSWTGGRGW